MNAAERRLREAAAALAGAVADAEEQARRLRPVAEAAAAAGAEDPDGAWGDDEDAGDDMF